MTNVNEQLHLNDVSPLSARVRSLPPRPLTPPPCRTSRGIPAHTRGMPPHTAGSDPFCASRIHRRSVRKFPRIDGKLALQTPTRAPSLAPRANKGPRSSDPERCNAPSFSRPVLSNTPMHSARKQARIPDRPRYSFRIFRVTWVQIKTPKYPSQSGRVPTAKWSARLTALAQVPAEHARCSFLLSRFSQQRVVACGDR